MSPEEAALGLDAVLHLTAGLVKLTGATRGHADDAELSRNSLLALAKKYIEDHLFDPGLDAARIRTALGISRTRLYEVFGELGGVNSAVRDARLDRVKAILCDRSDNRRIEQISRTCGFLDYPSFCRAYRRRFGQSPRDTREESSTLQFQPTSLR
jgi:AraC-like DNA-binding protein